MNKKFYLLLAVVCLIQIIVHGTAFFSSEQDLSWKRVMLFSVFLVAFLIFFVKFIFEARAQK
jgi:hypothetical protein